MQVESVDGCVSDSGTRQGVRDSRSDSSIEWLLEADPAIRWQVERDIVGAPRRQWHATRSLIASSGWGQELLGFQDASGTWAGGLYTPKWTSTTYTLVVLRRMGLAPTEAGARRGCGRLLDDARWPQGGVSYWPSHDYAERCVNGMVLSVCSYFEIDDERVDSIARLLMSARLGDGAWNCRDHQGATHSSFHTTISVLEALDLWRRFRGSSDADKAIDSGVEFLLHHRLFLSHRTGVPINPEWMKAHFPPRWHYDVLRGLDFLAAIGAAPDERAAEGIELLIESRRPDGRWPKGSQYSGDVFFPLEPGRVAGRWNTLRARRVLRWWSHVS